jgi:hypothetical protein
MIMIDPVDMIGDTLHATIQICSHVLWHNVYKRCNNAATTRPGMRASKVIGLPGREIKVQPSKGKNSTKADLPALNGREVRKVVEGRGVVLDAVLSPSDPCVSRAYKAWEAYECMSAAWSADPGSCSEYINSSTSTTRSREGIFLAFRDVAATAGVTPYMHLVVWHFTTWLKTHGCIDRYISQSRYLRLAGG